MTYQRFEDLPVWKESIRLAERIYAYTAQPNFRPPASFKSQLERAALSISNNIAEGFERGTTQELLTFIYIARGSAGEVRSMLCLLERHPEWSSGREEIPRIKDLAENCSRQLRGWADALQSSEIKGVRYLDKKSKEIQSRQKRAQAFAKELLEKLPWDHPLRKAERDKNRPD